MPNHDDEFKRIMAEQFPSEMPDDFAKAMRNLTYNQMVETEIMVPSPVSIEEGIQWMKDHREDDERD